MRLAAFIGAIGVLLAHSSGGLWWLESRIAVRWGVQGQPDALHCTLIVHIAHCTVQCNGVSIMDSPSCSLSPLHCTWLFGQSHHSLCSVTLYTMQTFNLHYFALPLLLQCTHSLTANAKQIFILHLMQSNPNLLRCNKRSTSIY